MKRFTVLFILMFFVSVCYAEKVVVVYRADNSVAVIHPSYKTKLNGESLQSFLERITNDATKGTDLEGLPYDIVDLSELPDREDRGYWSGSKGEGVAINTIKKAQDLKEKERTEKIKKRADEKALLVAEQELIDEGKIEGKGGNK